jgi:hypothetical protein
VIATVALNVPTVNAKIRRIEESKKSVTLRGFAAMSHKIPQEKGRKGDQGAGIIRRKTRAGGTALRAVERDTDPETQRPRGPVVLVFLDQCLALAPAAAGRRPASPKRDPPASDSSILRFFLVAVGPGVLGSIPSFRGRNSFSSTGSKQ